MRSFTDEDGGQWEVVVGRESYGIVVALFSPKRGSASPRQAVLDVSSPDEGSRVLREMSSEALVDLFKGSAEQGAYET